MFLPFSVLSGLLISKNCNRASIGIVDVVRVAYYFGHPHTGPRSEQGRVLQITFHSDRAGAPLKYQNDQVACCDLVILVFYEVILHPCDTQGVK